MPKSSTELTRRFALVGGIIIVAASTLLAELHREVTGIDLKAMAERNNVALARAFSNVIWPRYAEFAASAHELEFEALRADERIGQLRRDVLAQMKNLSVVKVKIYDLDGLTVFSTEPTQIGEDKRTNAGFRAARAGHVVSELTHRDTFSAFEQVIEDRDVLASYVPIGAPDSVQGVFEVYNDVTELLAQIKTSQRYQIAIVGGTFLVLYLLLVGFVWRSEQKHHRQHEENVKLARATAVAEEASRLKSEFLAHMSHELRTPLNAILGFSESLKAELFGPVGSRKYLEYASDIWASGRHLLAVIDDVLDMAKVEAGQLVLEESAFDPVEALRTCCRLIEGMARDAGVILALHAVDDCPRLWADERRFKQIMLNLLSNAVKFTPTEGSVTATLSRAASGGLEIVVTDTGIGIAPNNIAKVLTPFGRVDAPYSGTSTGTGLGLPIAASFAALHGGLFELSSELGEGTRVRVEFPAERMVEPAQSARTSARMAATA